MCDRIGIIMRKAAELVRTDEYRLFGYKLVLCPVCGSVTLDSHFICDECLWEYDGVTGENEYSSVNKASAFEYRQRRLHCGRLV